MIARLQEIWSARTSRERILIQAAAILLFGIMLPLIAYQSAARYRADAAARLENARQIERDIAELAKNPPPRASGGDMQSLAAANAQAAGVSIARIEPRGGARYFIELAPADAQSAYRWLRDMAKGGADVSRTRIVRTGANRIVSAEFEIGTAL